MVLLMSLQPVLGLMRTTLYIAVQPVILFVTSLIRLIIRSVTIMEQILSVMGTAQATTVLLRMLQRQILVQQTTVKQVFLMLIL